MSFYNENSINRILEILNYPVVARCPELGVLFDRCSLRELQAIFPTIIDSIFGMCSGGLGWGLRSTTKENSPQFFDILHDFFIPMGPMFRLCYRLLNDAIKFEFNIDMLPHRVGEMLQSGQYSIFYSDLLNIDPFRRKITSLSLNAFDYYILNFVIHGTFPLHKMYPAALQVHNERMKTIYFFLTAEYLCTFLPSSPDTLVMPTNICATVKAPQSMPVQPLQPVCSPKYLKIPNGSTFSSSPNNEISGNQASRSTESPRTHAWRTESVLHLFIDTWLRYDVEKTRELPSSEFIRVVRILVKQVHTFGNCAHLDQTSMMSLRKLSQPIMKAQMYPFLRSIIGRWPLDSSLSVVLELWLSYIQPWRYTLELQSNNSMTSLEIPINNRFDNFILDNLPIYTQIFIYILPRFERIDFTSLRNTVMLHRLFKVFSQTTLPNKLFSCEQTYLGNTYGMDSPHQRSASFYRADGSSSICDWDNIYNEESYIPMFGPEIKKDIEQFVKTIHISKMCMQQEISQLRSDILKTRRNNGFFKKLFSNIFEDATPAEIKLQEIIKIPDILDIALRSISIIFDVEIPNISMDEIDSYRNKTQSQVNVTPYDNSDYLDISQITPTQAKKKVENMKATIDPGLIPIQSHECTFLVRSLHQVSCKINEMFSEELQKSWDRSDIWGKLTKQILNPPMTAQWFDKPQGINQLCEENLPPRISLRPFASYRTIASLGLALLIGKLLWGVPMFGLSLLIILHIFYLFILAIIA